MKVWELQDIWEDIPSNEVLFNYILKKTQDTDGTAFDEKVWWWNDKNCNGFCIDLHDTTDAIIFITDYIEANDGTTLNIRFELNSIVVELMVAGHHYSIGSHFREDAHTKIFTMTLWVVAKSLGYGVKI